jgi:hypothetical protein
MVFADVRMQGTVCAGRIPGSKLSFSKSIGRQFYQRGESVLTPSEAEVSSDLLEFERRQTMANETTQPASRPCPRHQDGTRPRRSRSNKRAILWRTEHLEIWA